MNDLDMKNNNYYAHKTAVIDENCTINKGQKYGILAT